MNYDWYNFIRVFWSTCKRIIEPQPNDMKNFQLYKFLLRDSQEKACSILKRCWGVIKITGFIHKNLENTHLKDRKYWKYNSLSRTKYVSWLAYITVNVCLLFKKYCPRFETYRKELNSPGHVLRTYTVLNAFVCTANHSLFLYRVSW